MEKNGEAVMHGAKWHYDEDWQRNVIKCDGASQDYVSITNFNYGNTTVDG